MPPALQDEAAPYLTGRFDQENFEGARFAWSGSSMAARFTGTQVQIDLDEAGTNQYAVLIDGKLLEAKFVPSSGRQLHPLASGLAPGQHSVVVHKLTEANLGEAEFFGFAFPDGELLPYFVPAERRMEIIGDSITAGFGNEGESRDCPFSADTENHYLTYGAITARNLGAELVTVAWSGKGVFSNRGSSTDTIPMPVLWERTLPARDSSAWDFSRYQPHAVVINLGTNDMAPENPDKAPFAEKYREFIGSVREAYPSAALFLTLGPLLSDAWPPGEMILSRSREALQATIDAHHEQGDTQVYLVEFPAVTEAEGYGCLWHPHLGTHRRMAEQLTEAIRTHLGW